MKTSLSFLLSSMLALLVVALCGASLYLVWDAATDLHRGLRSETLASADRILYQNLQGIRVRRVQGEFNLMNEDNARPKIEELYKGVQQDAAATSAALRAVTTPESDARARDLDEKVAALAAGYQTLQNEAGKPKPERKAAASQDWYKGITAILSSMSASSLMMSNEARMITPAVAELISIRQLSWNVRDYSGNECGATRTNVARNQNFTPEQAKTLNNNLRGRQSFLAADGRNTVAPGADAGLRRANEETKKASTALRRLSDAIYSKLAAKARHRTSAPSPPCCNGMYDDIVGIGLSALELARNSVQANVADARFRLILAVRCSCRPGRRRLDRADPGAPLRAPLRGLTDSVAKLSAGRYDVPVPSTGHQDELGRLSEALEKLRLGAQRNTQLEEEAAAAPKSRSAARVPSTAALRSST